MAVEHYDAPERPTLDDFDAAVARIAEREAQARADRGLWLSHHRHDGLDRCLLIAGRHVCRRCSVLYSIAFAVAALSFVNISPWPARFDSILIWVLCVPATIDFVGEQLKLMRYSDRRQVVVTALLAPAVGRGMGYELESPGSWLFWGPVLLGSIIWFTAAIVGYRRRR